MTVVRLSSGELLVHDPVAPTEECLRLLNELGGKVAYIVLATTGSRRPASPPCMDSTAFSYVCAVRRAGGRQASSTRCSSRTSPRASLRCALPRGPAHPWKASRLTLCVVLSGPGQGLRGPGAVELAHQPAAALPHRWRPQGRRHHHALGCRPRAGPLHAASSRKQHRIWPSPTSLPHAVDGALPWWQGIGPANEVVFFHKKSKTLICTDLVVYIKSKARTARHTVVRLRV